MDSVLYDTHAVRYSNCPLRASDPFRNKPKLIVFARFGARFWRYRRRRVAVCLSQRSFTVR